MLDYRAIPGTEVRAINDDRHTVEARILTYNRSDNHGSVWTPGVFAKSLAERLPPVCWGHDQKRPIGRVTSYRDGTDALDVTIKMADPGSVPDARMAWSMLTDGIIDAWSVGFNGAQVMPVPSSQRSAYGSNPAREVISSARLGEISAVANASVPGTATLALRRQSYATMDVDRIFARHGIGDSSWIIEELEALEEVEAELDLAEIFAKHRVA